MRQDLASRTEECANALWGKGSKDSLRSAGRPGWGRRGVIVALVAAFALAAPISASADDLIVDDVSWSDVSWLDVSWLD